MEDQYRNTGLKVIWIGFQDRKDKIVAFLTKHGVQASLGYDTRDRISRQYGIKYGAGIVLIDRDGIVRKRVPKGVSEKVLRESIEYVLKAPPARIEKRPKSVKLLIPPDPQITGALGVALIAADKAKG